MAIIEQFVSIEILRNRYNRCPEPEYPSLYPNTQEVKQGKRNQLSIKKDEIAKAYQEWYEDIQFYEGRKPKDEEYTKEINSIKEIIRFIDKKMDPDRFFQNGPDDTTLCKQYLQRMKNKLWDEDKEDLKCMFHAWQWLLRKKAEDCPEATSVVKAVKEEEEITKVFSELHLNNNNRLIITPGVNEYKYGNVLIAVMHMYQEDMKSWAENPKRFSEKLVNTLPEIKNLPPKEKKNKALALAKCMNRELKDIKRLHLSTLSVENIMKTTDCYEYLAKQVYKSWEGLYPHVLQCRDTIRRRKRALIETGEDNEEICKDISGHKET